MSEINYFFMPYSEIRPFNLWLIVIIKSKNNGTWDFLDSGIIPDWIKPAVW